MKHMSWWWKVGVDKEVFSKTYDSCHSVSQAVVDPKAFDASWACLKLLFSNWTSAVETPPSTYWKEVADERRKALYSVLQENEKVS